jgi:hypothetical protein
MNTYLTIDGDSFSVHCPHGSRTTERTHDITIPESEEYMIRYALQRHVDRCERGCTIDIWVDWFEKRRERFIREGNARAHG